MTVIARFSGDKSVWAAEVSLLTLKPNSSVHLSHWLLGRVKCFFFLLLIAISHGDNLVNHLKPDTFWMTCSFLLKNNASYPHFERKHLICNCKLNPVMYVCVYVDVYMCERLSLNIYLIFISQCSVLHCFACTISRSTNTSGGSWIKLLKTIHFCCPSTSVDKGCQAFVFCPFVHYSLHLFFFKFRLKTTSLHIMKICFVFSFLRYRATWSK